MILNDNSTQQINTLVIQLRNKITNLTNEFRKLNNNINDLDSEISDLERRVSSNENDADNNIDGLDSKISDLEKRVSSNENNAAAMNAEISANTEAISGKADKIHTHTKSQITDFPTSLPANGGTADKATSVVDYGDTSRTIQIGYTGAGATVDNLSHIAGYLTGGTQIKDVSKSVLQAWLGLSNYLPLSGGTVTGATQFNNYVKLNAWDGYGTGTANFWYDGNNKFVEIENATNLKLSGVNVSKEGHTHTKSQITDFPTSLPANGGTADSANNGFNSSTITDSTPGWGYLTSANGYSNGRTYGFANGGGIATAEKDTQSSLQIDGVFYQNEGKYKVVDENSLKDIMKPNYTTGRLPAGVYKAGQSVSVSASITTTRGNPVFISYAGDFNSVNQGSTVPWIAFELFVDGQIVQRTSVDDSVALESDNTPFAGNALAVLSAGSHTIRLVASLRGNASGQIQFQEQDNLVNLVAFEL